MNLDEKTIKKLLIVGGIVIVILLVVLLIILLVRDEDEVDENDEVQETITLEYWGLWETEEVMQPIINSYEEQNPHINIEYTQRSWGGAEDGPSEYDDLLFTRLAQAINEGSPAPDIVKINNTWLPRYELLLEPAPENIIDTSEYSERFFPTASSDFIKDGNIYGMPVGIDGLLLFYNKELLPDEGPPSDWDSFTQLAQDLTEKDDQGNISQAGAALGSTNNVFHSPSIIALLLQQNNAEVIYQNAEGLYEANMTDRDAQDALEFYRSFEEEHKVWSSDLHNDLEMFFRGELAMMFAPSWRAFCIMNAAPHIEFDTATPPQLEANEPVNYAKYWGKTVSRASDHPEEAWRFINFLTQEENIKKLHSQGSQQRLFGQPYPLRNLQNELLEKRYVGAVMEFAPNLEAWPMSQYPEIEEEFDYAIEDASEAERNINEILGDENHIP